MTAVPAASLAHALALALGLALGCGTANAQSRTFLLASPLPLPIQVRILGEAPGFPQVIRLPAPPAPPVPVAYPGLEIRIQIRQPNGQWSPVLKLPWRAGPIAPSWSP